MAARILGISAFCEESAAAMVVDGEIVAAAQEERFTGITPERGFPVHSVNYCLDEAGVTAAEVDHVVFYDPPNSRSDRMIARCFAWLPGNIRTCISKLWEEIRRHFLRPRQIRRAFPGGRLQSPEFVDHYNAQAACAFFPSPFEEAAILLWDDDGDQTRIRIGRGRGNKIELIRSIERAVSLARLNSAIARFCGFSGPEQGELFASLAPYGNPKYVDLIRTKIIEVHGDGSFSLSRSFFHPSGEPKPSFERLLPGRPRRSDAPITRREIDLSRSMGTVGADLLLHLAKMVRETTGCRNLCLAGDMAVKCIAYGSVVRENVFDDVWMPACEGGASGALGAALFTQFQLLDAVRRASAHDSLKGSLLGPRFNNETIHGFLRSQQIEHDYCPDESELLQKTVAALREGKTVGWFQGRMEFGPHALGARSILREGRSEAFEAARPLGSKGCATLSAFAVSVLVQDAPAFFDLERESPYVQLVGREGEKRRLLQKRRDTAAQEGDVAAYLHASSRAGSGAKGDIAARVQTVDEGRCGRYYRLIRELKRQSGSGMIINTDFSMPGRPIVGTPQDAYRCFLASNIDVLVLENCIVRKDHARPEKVAPVELSLAR